MAKATCTKCKKSLPLSRFETSPTSYGEYRRKVCKECYYKRRNNLRSESPYKYLKTVLVQLKSKRVKEGIAWDLTWEELCEVWDDQAGFCNLSKVLMTFIKGKGHQELNASIDRIDGTGPYTKDNVQLVCHRVNLLKHTLSDEELYWWCKNIVTKKEKF